MIGDETLTDPKTIEEVIAQHKKWMEETKYHLDMGRNLKKSIREYVSLQPNMFEYTDAMCGIFDLIDKREKILKFDLKRIEMMLKEEEEAMNHESI